MRKISLDSILLFVLVVPFIMGYRLSPNETPYWLFGFIFFLLLGNIVLDLINFQPFIYNFIKETVLWTVILAVIGSAFFASIVVRHRTAPTYMIHDIVLQQESAIRFLLDGKNPYKETYFNTPLEQWHYSDTQTNPALYHFVMQPFYLLFALPFYGISNIFFGYFDGRMPLIFLFAVTLITARFIVTNDFQRRLFIVLLAFNPAMLPYILEGRSDIFMYAFLILAFFLLEKKHYSLSSFWVALAFAVKQSAWPLFPLYIAYLYLKVRNLRMIFRYLLIFALTFLVIVAPFVLWDTNAFLQSTVFYLSGSGIHSYPISGYGLGSLLLSLGLINDANSNYPFFLWQLAFCLPVFYLLYIYLRRNTSVSGLIFAYGILLFVFWYTSRYFHNSHVGFLTMIFVTSYFWPHEKNGEIL